MPAMPWFGNWKRASTSALAKLPWTGFSKCRPPLLPTPRLAQGAATLDSVTLSKMRDEVAALRSDALDPMEAAVRQLCETILKARGEWAAMVVDVVT